MFLCGAFNQNLEGFLELQNEIRTVLEASTGLWVQTPAPSKERRRKEKRKKEIDYQRKSLKSENSSRNRLEDQDL
jgi:hypothetical protein